MTNVWRVLRWSLSIGGGGLGFWYLKQSTRNQNHSELPFTPSDRLRALLGFDEHDRDQGPSVERWRIPQSPLVAQIRETTDERPGSFTTYDLDPDPSFVDPMEAIGPLELIEDVFPGPFREEIEVFDPFEPNAPPEHELDDHPPEVPVANVAEVLAREESGNVAEPAGGDVPAPDQDASEDATGSAGENSGSLAAERVPDPEVSNVIGAADGDMRADAGSGSNENRDSRDGAGSSGDDDENMIVRLGGLLSEERILSPPPQPHREARSEESDDDQS